MNHFKMIILVLRLLTIQLKKIKKENQIIPSVNYNSVEDDISYMSTSDILYSENENAFEGTSRGWVGFSI